MRARVYAFIALITVSLTLFLLPPGSSRGEVLNGHTVILDSSGLIIPWTADPAQGYDQVVNLAWKYLLNSVPNDSSNGKPAYYSHSYLNPDSQQAANWPHNPAGLYSMLTESALKYYGYSGDLGPVTLAQNVATALLDNGMTTAGWNWSNVPYASGDSGSLTYRGAAYGDTSGRGDGTGFIEPDKVGEMGYAWLQLYRFDGNTRFRDAAIAAADALASHVRTGSATQSPWPFRVNAQTGVVREEYCANVIGPISLFDGLISLGLGNTAAYQGARQTAWNWMMTYPMQNNVWANYFEDVPIQPDTGNSNNYNPMMTARYLLEHPEYDPSWESHVRGLIAWVETTFGARYGVNTMTIAEQIQYKYPMGSHTSRYASVNALLYDKTGDLAAKEKAYRSLNWATYMARANGVVIDGPSINQQWFTDGYGDYIRHFMTSLAAVPEWVPNGQNHLLRSSSVVKNISYLPLIISYSTADTASIEELRVNFRPDSVTVDGQPLAQGSDLSQAGWTYDPLTRVLRIRHDSGSTIRISQTLTSLDVTPVNQVLSAGRTLQYTATGSFSDGSVQDLTGVVIWSSSNSAVAGISSSGLATALTPGTTTITATLGGVSKVTTLAVQASSLSITTSSLPDGAVGAPFTATLAASGGTSPYLWALGSGGLPQGLTLNSGTGVISGTPTAAGTFTFSVQVTDSSTPRQSATRSFSFTIAGRGSYSIWPGTAVPVVADGGPDNPVELGVKFRSDASGFITGIRFYKASTNTGTHVANLWTSTGTRLATATFTNETPSGWQQVNFPSQVAIAANTVYVASYHTNVGHYSADQSYFAGRGVDNAPLHVLADGVSGANGVYAYGSTSTFPSSGWRSSNYWVDVVASTTPVNDTTPPTVTAFAVPAAYASLTVPVLSFAATDSVGVTGYLISETATTPLAGAGWTATAPASYTFTIQGSKTLYGWARDAAGNVSASRSAFVSIDTIAPAVTAFTVPTSATTLTIPITALTASDNVAVTAYLISESSTKPTPTATGWTATPPVSYTFSTQGSKTLYVWARDAAGNVSASGSATVAITLSDAAPTVTAFILPATVNTLTVTITSFTATSNLGITGYLVTESASTPAAAAAGWTATAPTSYTFTTQGSKTLYGWAKDAAGNVSAPKTASVVIDMTRPAAPTNVTASASAPNLVNLRWTAALDNVGVTGYRVLRSGSQIGSTGSTSYADSTVLPGTSYGYTVRAYDAAGNLSVDSNTANVTTPTGSAPPVLDVTVTTRQSTASRTISSPTFSTASQNELLVAFIASDGPSRGGSQRFTAVTGGGLTWTLRARANAQPGVAEIWVARATNIVSNITVTATRATGSYQGMITVAAFQGASLTANGAAANASAAGTAPALTLSSTRANSVTWGVGNDWDRATACTVGAGQTKASEFLAPANDTFWVQYLTLPSTSIGALATISCTAPTGDRWNLAGIEILPL